MYPDYPLAARAAANSAHGWEHLVASHGDQGNEPALYEDSMNFAAGVRSYHFPQDYEDAVAGQLEKLAD